MVVGTTTALSNACGDNVPQAFSNIAEHASASQTWSFNADLLGFFGPSVTGEAPHRPAWGSELTGTPMAREVTFLVSAGPKSREQITCRVSTKSEPFHTINVYGFRMTPVIKV